MLLRLELFPAFSPPLKPPALNPPAPGNLERGLVSCTGSQFCGFALIETKQRAMAVVEKLEAALDIPKAVRIHWTGCPNSCGQAQVQSNLGAYPGAHDTRAVAPHLFRSRPKRLAASPTRPSMTQHIGLTSAPTPSPRLTAPSQSPHLIPPHHAPPHPPRPLHGKVGDIGLMGAPAKLNGKAVEGVRIFLGGKVRMLEQGGRWTNATGL
jgi:hypothetical protein